MIQLDGAFLENRVNSNLIGMKAKERVFFAFYTRYLYSPIGVISLDRAWNNLEY